MAEAHSQTRSQARQKKQYAGANRAEPLPIPPGPHRRAGRKRGISRGMRRFESALGRVDLPTRVSSGKHLLTHLRTSTWHLSKLASALLLAGVITALYSIHTQDDWFVYAEDIRFENTTYLDAPELHAQLDIQGWNILWLRPEAVREQILNHAGVTDAHVRLGLPGQVEITVS
ncbi:MAG: FtsQ-type POTRA domain-containing protein, partial [Litorilinea sp.]